MQCCVHCQLLGDVVRHCMPSRRFACTKGIRDYRDFALIDLTGSPSRDQCLMVMSRARRFVAIRRRCFGAAQGDRDLIDHALFTSVGEMSDRDREGGIDGTGMRFESDHRLSLRCLQDVHRRLRIAQDRLEPLVITPCYVSDRVDQSADAVAKNSSTGTAA
jgi:hypothetical protein